MAGIVEQFRAAASDLAARSKFARWAGKTFGGERDMYEVLGFKRELGIDDYRLRYERGGIAGRIIEVKPESTWQGIGEVVENEDSKRQTTFEKTWQDLNTVHDFWSIFFHVDVLAGLGRYGAIL